MGLCLGLLVHAGFVEIYIISLRHDTVLVVHAGFEEIYIISPISLKIGL